MEKEREEMERRGINGGRKVDHGGESMERERGREGRQERERMKEEPEESREEGRERRGGKGWWESPEVD